jgi:kynurenine formamidase
MDGLVMAIVDLSQEIYQGMPVYEGHLRTVVWQHEGHEETGRRFEGGFSFASRGMIICDHGPTHVDAISHLDPDPAAPTIDTMDLELFCGPGTCIDVSHAQPREYISADELAAAESAAGTEVRRGEVLLICTGTYARVGGTPEYTKDYPGLDDSAAEWLHDRGVKIFGVDSPSPDNPISPTYPVHMMCRREGITHYENLANLEQLVGRRFEFFGLPLRIRGGTGSPVRAVAKLEG